MGRTVRSVACRLGIAMLFGCTTLARALAVTPDEVLQDPLLEQRARALSQGLRCVVCQNQSIDESNAPLAHDLRVLLRERLLAGDSDREAVDFIVARYGNFVLLKPPLQWNTGLLWFGPGLLLLVAGAWFYRHIAAESHAGEMTSGALSGAEERRVELLLDDGGSA